LATRSRHPGRGKLAASIAVILVISILAAIPVFLLSQTWSISSAEDVYNSVGKLINITSAEKISDDENGIPVVDYGTKNGVYIGPQRNPLTIATRALAYYDNYLQSKSAQDKTFFLNCVNWLDQAKIDKGGYWLWAYTFDLPAFNVKAPWYSAMTQARIMVAFQRAYELTGDKHYLDAADQALKSLEVDIQDGGVAVSGSTGGKWFEEVVGGDLKSTPLVLNGHIFVLFDLDDFYSHTGSIEARTLFNEGVLELKGHISQYDTGHWTYYDRIGHLAYDYHYVHIDQMQRLFDITGDPLFKEYHDKWSAYFPFNPMWARKRFAAYLLDFVIVFCALLVIYFVYRAVRKHSRISNRGLNSNPSRGKIVKGNQ